MKAKTKKNVGLVTAAIMIIFGMGLPPFGSINIWRSLAWIVLPAIYIYGLKGKKLKLARAAFNIWLSVAMLAMIIILFIPFFGNLPDPEGAPPLVLLLLFIGLGLITFLWWVGLRGLKSMLNTEIQATKEILQNPEKG
ncbi:MAG TPA: hypothetical protein VMW23_09970 [Sedimentisphaerales bacterium]|nr:hypothetical protein [Sedimentisphaerales bacterium]